MQSWCRGLFISTFRPSLPRDLKIHRNVPLIRLYFEQSLLLNPLKSLICTVIIWYFPARHPVSGARDMAMVCHRHFEHAGATNVMQSLQYKERRKENLDFLKHYRGLCWVNNRIFLMYIQHDLLFGAYFKRDIYKHISKLHGLFWPNSYSATSRWAINAQEHAFLGFETQKDSRYIQ